MQLGMSAERIGGQIAHKALDVIGKVNRVETLLIVVIMRVTFILLNRNSWMSNWLMLQVSKHLSNGAKLDVNRTFFRKLFREATLTPGGLAPNVLHPEPRRDRLTALKTIQSIISQTGTHEPYHFQPRPTQIKDKHRMVHHWACDTSVPHRDTDSVEANHVITQIDSDYYVDMNAHDVLNNNPQLLYTFDPLEAAAAHTDYPAWTFIDDETIEVTSPAEKYSHKLWDYTGNEVRHFRLNHVYDAKFTIFELEKRRIDETHSLVFINPRVHYEGLRAFIAKCWFGTQEFKRVNVGGGPYSRMVIQRQEENAQDHIVSVARKNHFLAATCKKVDYDHMYELTLRSKLGCTVPKIKTKTTLTDAPAALLTNYLNDLKKEVDDDHIWYKNYSLDYAVRIHQYFPSSAASTDPKGAVVAFANALIDGCHVHSNELASEKQAIEGRLTKLIQPFTLTAKHTKYMDAFIKRLVPEADKHTLIMCDDDEVFEHQNRPTQKTILEYALECNEAEEIISTFAKKEAAQKINDTRIISVGKPAGKLAVSKFLYPFQTWLKKQKWYCFGRTPAKLASHLAKIANHAQMINCTDFSRMDGRKTIALRTFNYKLMASLFGKEHIMALRDIYERGCNVRGFTPTIDGESFFFETYMAWASGDPFTSSFNSSDNSLIVFTGFVNKHTDNGKMKVTEEIFDSAYQELIASSCIAGDDTCLADMPNDCIVAAASWWGHVLTSEVYQRGEPGVNFLARVYGPDLWNGDPNSTTDLMRALSKLHVTPSLFGFTPLEKMAMKLTSLLFTDGNSPIISSLISAWLDVGGKLAEKHERQFMSYWSKYDLKDQYPNRCEDWMYDTLPYDEINWDLYVSFLQSVREPADFLYMPTIWTQPSVPMKNQQVTQTIGDEQELIGPDENRLEEPQNQQLPENIDEVDTNAPSDAEIGLNELLEAPREMNSPEEQKDIIEDNAKTVPVVTCTVETPTNTIPNPKVNRRKQLFIAELLKEHPNASRKQCNYAYTKHLKNLKENAKLQAAQTALVKANASKGKEPAKDQTHKASKPIPSERQKGAIATSYKEDGDQELPSGTKRVFFVPKHHKM